MSMNFKKALRKDYTYDPKNSIKHKHDYTENYVLEITNDNIHASCNYYQKKEYYDVLKCSLCDSFIPNSKKGIYDGNIFNKEDIDQTLPLITAKTKRKSPAYEFYNLYDVKVEKGVKHE